MTEDPELKATVDAVLAWMKKHPNRDHIDACFSVVASPSPRRPWYVGPFATSRWGELLEAVKLALQNPERRIGTRQSRIPSA